MRAPWVTEQQTAPAKAKREYRSMPVGAVGSILAAIEAFAASSLDEPVEVGGEEVAMMVVPGAGGGDCNEEWSGGGEVEMVGRR